VDELFFQVNLHLMVEVVLNRMVYLYHLTRVKEMMVEQMVVVEQVLQEIQHKTLEEVEKVCFILGLGEH
jgi:hypothetical protein